MRCMEYPSDLSDAQWQIISRLLPKPKKRGRKPIDRQECHRRDPVLEPNGMPMAVFACRLPELEYGLWRLSWLAVGWNLETDSR